MLKIPTSIPLPEMRLIIALFEKGLAQKAIKIVVDKQRKTDGVYKGSGISTNTISRLSGGSKHRAKYEKRTREIWGRYGVIPHIAKCLHISQKEALKVYQKRILNSGVAPFGSQHDALSRSRETGLVSVRFEHERCNTPLYLNFTSDDYPEEYEGESDVWTIDSPFTYDQLIKGEIGLSEIEAYLIEQANGEYEPVFLNVLVKKT